MLLLGAGVLLSLWTLEREVEARMQDDVELVARALRLPVAHAIERGRTGTLARALQSALEIRRVYGVTVFDAGGNRLASLGSSVPDEPAERRGELAQQGELVGEYASVAGEELYSYFVPLADSWERPLGLLQVTRSRSDVALTLARLRGVAAGVFLIGVAVVLFLVLLGHHRAVGGPLERLQASMRRVQRGDRAHRATPEGPSELVELGEAFNSMLGALDRTERELTTRRRSQARLREELTQAEKLAAVGELAGGIAHELGSPLAVVDGVAQRLRRGAQSDLKEGASVIRRQVRRMEEILRRLLTFGRREAGRVREARMEEVVRAAAAAASEEPCAQDVSIELDGPRPTPRIPLQVPRMREALEHLIRNACQATPSGQVRVAWSHTAETAEVMVCDDGPGVPNDIASRIFEPFFTTKPTGTGSGLGLAFVHGVVSSHGGSISLVPSPLGGAAFRVRIPVSGVEPEAHLAALASGPAAKEHG